jgi:hypothetical protein
MFGVDFTNCIKMECSKQIAILTRVMLLDQFNEREIIVYAKEKKTHYKLNG